MRDFDEIKAGWRQSFRKQLHAVQEGPNRTSNMYISIIFFLLLPPVYFSITFHFLPLPPNLILQSCCPIFPQSLKLSTVFQNERNPPCKPVSTV